MSTRARYQFGCLTRRKRVRGGDVWQFRFNETTVEERRCRRSRLSNPIDLVRQSAGRKTIPRTLSTREIGLLLRQLAEPYRTMVLVAACLGLRVSEIIGLQWGDFNWDDLTLLVKRSVVHGRVGDTNTEASRLPLPVDPRLARNLQEHWKRSSHRRPQDWVFGNRDGRPRWQESILHRQLKPAAVRAGLGKIGWHTFRHSYSSLLRGAHVDLKVEQELLRHATIQSTINIYTRAVPKQKRAANRLVVDSLLRAQSRKSVSLAVLGKRDPKGTDCNLIATQQRTQSDWNDGT
jgi:integrase